MRYIISEGTDIIAPGQIREWGAEALITVDEISNDLSNLPQDKDSLNVVFIPTVFDTSNSLSYGGANLALRVLMHYLRNGITNFNIVLMGFESEENFLLHYFYPNILKIPGIRYTRFNKKIVSEYCYCEGNHLKVDEYVPLLDNLGLKIPSSFKSTHSLTNEWCLFKWNSFWGIQDCPASLMGHLFFEYLITLEKLGKLKNKVVTEHLKERIRNIPSARILLIDDNVGWHSFFTAMLADNPNIEIECLGENFNKLLFSKISSIIEEKINKFNPHVIILDFRLMEDQDAEIKDDMKRISGYKVLRDILKGNYVTPKPSFGRQVLIFTATSRIENILMLREGYADGFILKEKPENYNGKEITKDVIATMVSLLGTAIDRAKFLIPMNERLKELSILASSSDSELKQTIKMVSESVRQITQNNKLNEDALKLSYLNLFSILEHLKPSHYRNMDSYIQENAPNDILRYWNNINNVRNALAHGKRHANINHKDILISAELIKEWQIRLCNFVKEFIVHRITNNRK